MSEAEAPQDSERLLQVRLFERTRGFLSREPRLQGIVRGTTLEDTAEYPLAVRWKAMPDSAHTQE